MVKIPRLNIYRAENLMKSTRAGLYDKPWNKKMTVYASQPVPAIGIS